MNQKTSVYINGSKTKNQILDLAYTSSSAITCTIGINLYVVQGVRGRGSLNDVMVGSLPLVITMFVMVGLLMIFPQIAFFLPSVFD